MPGTKGNNIMSRIHASRVAREDRTGLPGWALGMVLPAGYHGRTQEKWGVELLWGDLSPPSKRVLMYDDKHGQEIGKST